MDREQEFHRGQRLARIANRLHELDDQTLAELDDWTRSRAIAQRLGTNGPDVPAGEQVCLSRRRFLSGLAAGGVALVGSNVATGLISWHGGKEEGALEAERALRAELARCEKVLALYRELEEAGLGEVAEAGATAVAAALGDLTARKALLQGGISVIEEQLARLELVFDQLWNGAETIQEDATLLEATVAEVWQLMSQITGIAAPLSDAIRAFFSNILEKIPFGVSAQIQQILGWIQTIVGTLPEFLAAIQAQLLAPLAALNPPNPDGEEDRNQAWLIALKEEILEPVKGLLGQIETMEQDWDMMQERLVNTLADYEQALAQIESYRGKEVPPES